MWTRQAQVSIEPHETKGWTADSEPAARCVGWREHMACILKTTLLLGGPRIHPSNLSYIEA